MIAPSSAYIRPASALERAIRAAHPLLWVREAPGCVACGRGFREVRVLREAGGWRIGEQRFGVGEHTAIAVAIGAAMGQANSNSNRESK